MGSTDSKDAILDAAERVFGSSGYAGGSMREISLAAGVAQALLHYHFKSKDALYREVFKRRSASIVEFRRAKLRELFAIANQKPDLQDLLAIMMTPLPTIFSGKSQNTRHYLQMVAEVTVATDERSKEIMSTFYDPIGKEIIRAFMRVVPGLSKERAVWAYLFAMGARLQAHSGNGSAERLMGRPGKEQSPHAMLVPFVAVGIRAIANLPAVTAPGRRVRHAAGLQPRPRHAYRADATSD